MAEVPGDAQITSYAWDLGDGTQAMGPSVAHTYGSAERFQVRLTVTDSRGRTALATTMIQAMPDDDEPEAAGEPEAASATDDAGKSSRKSRKSTQRRKR